MFSHKFDQGAGFKVIFHWFLLSFNGGCINAGGFLATGRFVSHVTGFATLFGVDVAQNQIEAALGIVSVPLFFLLGAFISGLLVDRPLHKGQTPHFDWVMGLSALCLLFSAFSGDLLRMGEFGDEVALKTSYALLGLLCLASGLQNAAITTASGRSVRTTHMTGLTTDLGVGLARVFSFNLIASLRHKEIRANYLRLGSIGSFILGSGIGAWIFLKFGYKGFALPAAIALYAAWHGRRAKVQPHMIQGS